MPHTQIRFKGSGVQIPRGRATVMGARRHNATDRIGWEGGVGHNPQPGDFGGFDVNRSFAG